MVDRISSGNTGGRIQSGKRPDGSQQAIGKLSYLTNRLLKLAEQKGYTLDPSYADRLQKVDRYLRCKIDAAIEGGMRHMKVDRDIDSRLLKNAFLQGTKRELWNLIKSKKDLPQALGARQKSDAALIAEILITVLKNT